MASLARAPFPQFFSLVVLLSIPLCSRADDLTGMAQDDAKDLLPPSAQQSNEASSSEVGFLPLPSWARGVVLSSTPDVLKPMGRKPVLTTPPVPAPQPLAPEKDSQTVIVAKPIVVAPAAAPAATPTPALIAVSPFLDWIKSNPQAAAEQARQQAGAYQAAAGTVGAPAGSPAPNATGNAPAAPYWMPPLIDSAPFGSNGNVTGSSAAIYTTPQR